LTQSWKEAQRQWRRCWRSDFRRRERALLSFLAAEMGEEPEEERKAKAEEEACDDGEIESGVLAAVDDVAGKAAEAKRELAAEVEKSADKDEEGAENEESAAEFTDGIHQRDCMRNEAEK